MFVSYEAKARIFRDLRINPIPGRLFWSSGGQGGGGGAQSAPDIKNPVPLLRIYSSNIFLKAFPKLSLVKQTWWFIFSDF